jgi:hypothetical protein
MRPGVLAVVAVGWLGTVGADSARAGTVPDVVLSPAAAEAAAPVDAPIAEVTVFSDRARVRRRGRVAAGKAGVAIVRLPDLPGAAFLDTVRVAAEGARVLRVEATPVERDRLSIEQAVKLLDELDQVDDALAEVDDRAGTDERELTWLAALRPASPVPEEKRQGRKALLADVPSWTRALDFLAERGRRARERLAKIADERRGLAERRERLRGQLAQINQGGFSDRQIRVVAVVQAPAAGAAVELEYFVPGARWKPAYDLHFSPGRGQLRVETAAVVEQTTGEDWPAAALMLSTAIPGRGIDAPELLTWTLGERSELVPQLRPRSAPRVEPPLPPPSIRPARGQEAEGDVVRARIAQALQGPQGAAKMQAAEATEVYTAEARPRPRAHRVYAPQPAPSRSSSSGAPAAAPAMAPISEMEAEEAAPESAPQQSLIAEEQTLIVANKRSSSTPTTNLPLALFDSPSGRAAPTFGDPMLPAVSAGGLDYVYQAPTSVAVPSTGRQVRVPLAWQTFPAAAFHDATPALAATAFLRARVRNDGKRPLLRGPATIFSDGELVGVGELQTTGPGGDIEFPLGADEDVRLVRQVVPTTKTSGLIMKTDETTYDVQIQVGNYKKKKVVVELRDQVPRSGNEKVEVKMLGADPAPVAAPDADGVVRWRVELDAGTTRTVRLRYQITRPRGWKLYQR